MKNIQEIAIAKYDYPLPWLLPAEFDLRKYLGPARDNMEKMYKHKIINVLGSDGKLAK